jgi:flagellar biosynthesis/type III secretory pathway protein FliH
LDRTLRRSSCYDRDHHAARKSFEMLPQGQRFFSETQRRSFAEGEAKGKTEGRAEGQAQAILRVLERRNVPVSAEQRERILTCSDLATLGAWLD